MAEIVVDTDDVMVLKFKNKNEKNFYATMLDEIADNDLSTYIDMSPLDGKKFQKLISSI